MKSNPFGLDIGASTIKAVWLMQQKEGFFLNAALTISSPPRGILSESPIDQEEMARAIRQIVDEGKISTPYVNVALPENQVYTRVIEMPLLSDKELSSAIYWEAEQHIPVSLNNVTLDWRVLGRSNETNKMEVLLVGAPNTLIGKYQKIFSMAGLTIAALETEILSAVRSLITSDSFPNTLIVQIGAISTSLAIIKNGIIVFTYSVPTGGNAINRAIAADFGFSIEQAEEYKKTYGMSEKFFGGKIGQTTAPILMSIVNEIKKALVFYNEKYKGEHPILQIMLSGGTAKLSGVDLFFAEHCGIQTAIANPWATLGFSQTPKDILDNAPEYTIAVGLAMRV